MFESLNGELTTGVFLKVREARSGLTGLTKDASSREKSIRLGS